MGLILTHSLTMWSTCLPLTLPRRAHVVLSTIILVWLLSISTRSAWSWIECYFVLAHHPNLVMLTYQRASACRLCLIKLLLRLLNLNRCIMWLNLLGQRLAPDDTTHYCSFILKRCIYLTVIQVLLRSIIVVDVCYRISLLSILKAILSLYGLLRHQWVPMKRYLSVGPCMGLLLCTSSQSFWVGVNNNILDVLV